MRLRTLLLPQLKTKVKPHNRPKKKITKIALLIELMAIKLIGPKRRIGH